MAGTTIEDQFAGCTIVGTDRYGRPSFSITLPSGYNILNASGWGDVEWDILIKSATDPADIDALASLKGSWSFLQQSYTDQLNAKIAEQAQPVTEPSVDPAAPTNTDTTQQNDAYIASGGATDDNPGVQTFDDGSSIQTFDDGSTLVTDSDGNITSTPAPSLSTVNAGTTVAGKGGTSSAGKTSKPGKRLQNPLGEFSSYTYQLTLYMLTPDAYNAFVTSGKKNINAISTSKGAPAGGTSAAKAAQGVYVVAQSGGINNTTTNRAPGFTLDYYIDNVEISAAISQGKSGNSAGPAATNTSDIKFQIIEPYGFSFLSKLKSAWDGVSSALPNVTTENMENNVIRQTYVLGIRFLGYDAQGNVVTGQSRLNGNTIPSATAGPANGSFESFYDILISEIKFKLDGKAVTYNITAASTGDVTGKGLNNGRLLQDTTVVGATVGDMLKDLVQKLNQAQKNQKETKNFEIANQYEVVYIGQDADIIEGSSVVNNKVDSDKQKYPMQLVEPDKEITTSDEIEANEGGAKGDKRTLGFKGGVSTSIIQVIQTVVTQSDYIQQAIKNLFTNDTNPNPDPDTKTYETADENSNKTLKWINVSTEVINLGYDTKRNDFAWKITYIIQSYDTPVAPIPQAGKVSKYPGPSKRYSYWLTGKNTEVTRFELEYNSLYTAPSIGEAKETKSVIPKAVGRAAAPRQGRAAGEAMESQNSYVNYLNDPGAYASGKITILGDPDWLLQDNSSSLNSLFDKYYGTNGYTINCNNGQVFVEVDFKEAIDYDNTKGIMSVNDKLMFFDYPPEYKTGPNKIQGIAFNVTDIISTFKGGKFEQTLTLNASMWDTPKGQPSDSSRDNQSDAETQRLARQSATQGGTTNNTSTVGLVSAPDTTSTEPVQSASTTIVDANSNSTVLPTTTTTTATQITSPTGNVSNPVVATDEAQSQNITTNPVSIDGASEADQRAELPPTP